VLSPSAPFKGTEVGRMEVQLQSFLTTALDWHKCTASRLSCSTPEERAPVTQGLRSGSGGTEKEKNLLLLPRIESRFPGRH